jgi:uncharacterized protein YodC (DUF2158 family)
MTRQCAPLIEGNQMAERKFKIGDTVRLKSGGPTMTVNAFADDEAESLGVNTTWFATNGKTCEGTFLESMLYSVKTELEWEEFYANMA